MLASEKTLYYVLLCVISSETESSTKIMSFQSKRLLCGEKPRIKPFNQIAIDSLKH